jgi:quercetin dioxygenase-like cupin family protein
MLFLVARRGQMLANPVTRERLTFLETAADTGGEVLRLDFFFEPGGFVPAAHSHPNQQERIEVISGTPSFRIAGRERVAKPGDVIHLAPGTPHRWWNAAEVETHAVIELRPALRMESLFETMSALAQAGKLNRKGFPNPFQGAVIARAFKAEVTPARDPSTPFGWLPLPVLDTLLALLAPVGKAVGYRIPA